MLQFIYFGRLDTEKWRESIVQMIAYFSEKKQWELPFVLHIFGKGSYEQKIITLAKQFPEHIIYYGFQPLDYVKKIAEQCDYCLMPSLFLETFGLSAVNALARWLPVIGYKQWGMIPFVMDAYNLWSVPGSPHVQLIAILEKLIGQWTHNESKHCQKIAEQYTKKQWMDNFSHLLDPSLRSGWQKILLVTDFVNKFGGIETYIHDVAALLQEQWHVVEIIGSQWWTTKIGRLLSMVLSSCNVVFAYNLHKKIQQFSPDIIRCHSVLRHVGWLPLVIANRTNSVKRMMYHDLWYFHPFPHALTEESQIPPSLDWIDFSWSVSNPLKKIFVRWKWILLRLLQKQLKKFDLHLVPSEFMQASVNKNYSNNVTVLSHFIQE